MPSHLKQKRDWQKQYIPPEYTINITTLIDLHLKGMNLIFCNLLIKIAWVVLAQRLEQLYEIRKLYQFPRQSLCDETIICQKLIRRICLNAPSFQMSFVHLTF